MPSLEVELNNLIENVVEEISILKSMPVLYDLSPKRKEVMIKYSIPSFYSLWEGFVCKSFELYIDYINEKKIDLEFAHPNILTHHIDTKMRLSDISNKFDKMIEHVLNFREEMSQVLVLSTNIPTESNINYIVLNKILYRFNLGEFSDAQYHRLNKLLEYRNRIAHGEDIPVSMSTMNEISIIVIDCMNELTDILIKGLEFESYRKDS